MSDVKNIQDLEEHAVCIQTDVQWGDNNNDHKYNIWHDKETRGAHFYVERDHDGLVVAEFQLDICAGVAQVLTWPWDAQSKEVIEDNIIIRKPTCGGAVLFDEESFQ